jgi:hypothetical protein
VDVEVVTPVLIDRDHLGDAPQRTQVAGEVVLSHTAAQRDAEASPLGNDLQDLGGRQGELPL